MKTYVMTPHYDRLIETVPMMGQKVCFDGEINYPSYLFLSVTLFRDFPYFLSQTIL